jgi:hypothetical protein
VDEGLKISGGTRAVRQEMGTHFHKDGKIRGAAGVAPEIAMALLTGGNDRPYVFVLTRS